MAKPARHVAYTRRVVDELIEGHRMEGPEHQFHDRTHAEHGSADTHADETCFRNRSVNDAFVAPFVPQAFRDLVGTVVLGDFLAHDDDVRVALEFFIESFPDGVAVKEFA